MSQREELLLSQLLCSKICHDLVSPVGAVNSGLELLNESVNPENYEVVELIDKSAATASKRLSLFRFAFGYGATVSSLNDLKEVFENSIDLAKYKVTWDIQGDTAEGDEVKLWAKLVANLVIIGMEASPYGAEVHIQASSDPLNISLQIEGQTVAISDEIEHAVKHGGETAGLSPRTVQPALTNLLASVLGRSIMFERHGTTKVMFGTAAAENYVVSSG